MGIGAALGQGGAPDGQADGTEGGQGGGSEGGQGSVAGACDAALDPLWRSSDPGSVNMEGIDPNSSYMLKIRLFGNPKKARKEIRCFCFDKVIDSDLTNFKDFVESIIQQYPPRYLEVAHVQYYDNVLKILPEVKSDQDLLSMFEKHAKTKVVQIFIMYCDPSEPYEPITEYSSDVHIQADNNTNEADDSYLCNPIPENEHVGIDEEKMYLEKEHIPLSVVLFSDKVKDKSYVPEDESVDESEDGSTDESKDEHEVEEEEELHEPEHAPNVEYDKEDPPMTVGSIYPNMDEFRLALSQHAVKREFEYNTEKSTQRRFRGYCKRRDEDDCPWRIHASTTSDMRAVVATAGRPKTERYKGCSDKKRNKGKHLCPICKEYGHHWPKCKKGNPDDIAAMMAIREPPKKRAKTSKTAQSSIVPCEDEAPTRMCFPPSQSLETTTKKKRKEVNSKSVETKRSKISSSQLSIEKVAPVKVKAKTKKREIVEKIPMVPLDSPAMGTRSRTFNPPSPAMSTRSKRRLSL